MFRGCQRQSYPLLTRGPVTAAMFVGRPTSFVWLWISSNLQIAGAKKWWRHVNSVVDFPTKKCDTPYFKTRIHGQRMKKYRANMEHKQALINASY